jgi:hypothetical protein
VNLYFVHPLTSVASDNLGIKQIQNKADAMYKSLRKLEGVQYVLEALIAPVVDQHSASLLEVRSLLEGVRKVSQVGNPANPCKLIRMYFDVTLKRCFLKRLNCT